MAPSRPSITTTNEISLIPNFMAYRPPWAECCVVSRGGLLGPDLLGVRPRGRARRALALGAADFDGGGAGVGVHRVHHLGVGVEHHLDLKLAQDLVGVVPVDL